MRIVVFKFVLPLIIVFLSILSCESEEELSGELEDFFRAETYCADPWEQNNIDSDEELKEQVSEYLNNLDISYYDLKITHDGEKQFCFACHCTSGRLIRFKSDRVNQEILLENGFQME
ncbi:hypothetical protein [Marivirga sp.]|uniref:hypothetical protein n=1 Tax=Marivirga sp. TaxID=2018662 RepID=UPI003DA78D2F